MRLAEWKNFLYAEFALLMMGLAVMAGPIEHRVLIPSFPYNLSHID